MSEYAWDENQLNDADLSATIVDDVYNRVLNEHYLPMDKVSRDFGVDNATANRICRFLVNEADCYLTNYTLLYIPPLAMDLSSVMQLNPVSVAINWRTGELLRKELIPVLDGNTRGKKLKQRLLDKDEWEHRLEPKLWDLYMFLVVEETAMLESVSDARYKIQRAKDLNLQEEEE